MPTVRQISLEVPVDVLASFGGLARRAGLSRPKMLGALVALVARAEQQAAIDHDAEILRATAGDPDPELDAWVAGASPDAFDAN
jgi:hypothetical protein